ncbi:hypothetical protein DdX_03368 [Ditylenchus destructor]|uniref:Uncharacterized protein n=1 Tax=Ditylenchus destructor TaxID=166010 RepID=A0AAD4NG45_9BILA|nr:hypothetical protein DdX_03368 [Ditylenchus destructor]
MFSLVLFVMLGALSVTADQCNAPTSESCDANILACCDKNFRESLNIHTRCDGKAIYANATCAMQSIESIIFTEGMENAYKACSAFNLFRDCLGQTTRSCTTYPYYLQNKYTLFDSKHNQGLFTRLIFQCGAGLDAFLNNNKCMVNTAINNMGQFDTCRGEFVANVKADPDRTCDYMKEIEGCFEKPFLSDCGVEAAWWGCEIVRLTTSIIFPQCGGFCAAVTDAKTIT